MRAVAGKGHSRLAKFPINLNVLVTKDFLPKPAIRFLENLLLVITIYPLFLATNTTRSS